MIKNDTLESEDNVGQEAVDSTSVNDLQKVRKAVFIGGGIFALGFLFLVGVISWKLMTYDQGNNQASSVIAAGPPVNLTLPKSAKVISAGLHGTVVAITIELPDGQQRVDIIDLGKGETLRRLNIVRK